MSSEWECFRRAQQGDNSAWINLTKDHQPRLLSLALLITGSSAAAEDIVQETFIRAFRAKIKNNTGTVQGLLSTIAYRLALKELKRLKRNEGFDNKAIVDKKQNSLADILHDERDRLVAETICSLDNKHREILVLRFYADHSYNEIAELTKLSLGTVKSRIFYAVKRCREILREKGILE